ncbi:MAG: flavodoxin family protein [Sedimentisphaerales bacterium]|nr:flavodoxin family protein [Sedimentisphaerales bacterium]
MKILALSCSPRIGGNTDTLLDEVLRGAAENNCDIDKIYVSQLDIQPCAHCDFCINSGTCNIPDDMPGIYSKLIETDCLIFASPIYFMAHCAQAKLLIDRCQVFWARRYMRKESALQLGRPKRRGIFISVGATHGSKLFAGVKVTMKWFFDALEFEYTDNLLFEGIDAKGAIGTHPTALKEAYDTGRTIGQGKQGRPFQ